jgi:AraC-like DNA-binding protein
MSVIYEDRSSDTPFVQTVWRTQAQSDGCDIVSADMCWDMLIVAQEGKTKVGVFGPMTRTAHIPHTQGQEWIGVRFKPGTFMPHLSLDSMVNQGITLPEATGKSFWLDSSTWECPTYENVDTFVNRLVRNGLLVKDTVVEAALQGHPHAISPRTIQRRFLRATGLPQRTIRAIERAHLAASLLQGSMSILDVVYEVGYADQQTMTKSLKHLMGMTPAQIARSRKSEYMSLHDKTLP